LEPDARLLREVEGPFERRDGLGEVPLVQRPIASSPIRYNAAEGVIGGFGHPHPLFCGSDPLGEGTTLSKVFDEETAGEHGDQTGQAEVLME
jgi:hypothetical protein